MVPKGAADAPYSAYEAELLAGGIGLAGALGIEPNSLGFKGPSGPRPAPTNWRSMGVSIPLCPLERRVS